MDFTLFYRSPVTTTGDTINESALINLIDGPAYSEHIRDRATTDTSAPSSPDCLKNEQ